jgi:hypothetical protein
MRNYQMYVLECDSRLSGTRSVSAARDIDALSEARMMMKADQRVEVWHRARLVGVASTKDSIRSTVIPSIQSRTVEFYRDPVEGGRPPPLATWPRFHRPVSRG